MPFYTYKTLHDSQALLVEISAFRRSGACASRCSCAWPKTKTWDLTSWLQVLSFSGFGFRSLGANPSQSLGSYLLSPSPAAQLSQARSLHSAKRLRCWA